jgi:hypothetical protein
MGYLRFTLVGTPPRVRKLICERPRVCYQDSHFWLLLRNLGTWSCQEPAKQAVEQDEEAIRVRVKLR